MTWWLPGVKPSNGYIDWLKENHGKIEMPNGVTVIDADILDYEGLTETILSDTVYKLGRRSLDGGFEVTHYRYPNRAVEIDSEFSSVGIMPGIKNVTIELPENFSITNIDKLVATERAQGIEASKVVFYNETLGYVDDPNNVIPVVTVQIHKGSWADQHKQQLIPQKQERASMAKFEIEYVD